jgi:two-component system response regulator YesN
MWKVIIADDEGVIVKGLKNLIDWNSLDAEVVTIARDGAELKKSIEEVDPDIVVTDIMMPKMTGLDVIRWYNEKHDKARFIFISGYDEFSYAKDAIKNGAVDYLLKPVGRRDLEDAVRKAIDMLKEHRTAEIFREERDEIQDLFRDINDGHELEHEDLYQRFSETKIDFENKFFAGVCIGIRPDVAARLSEKSFQHFNLLRFSVYNKICEAFRGQKMGFTVKKDDCALSVMGVFPREHESDFIEEIIVPACRSVEEAFNTELCIGVGMPTDQISMLKNTYKTASFAFNLFFFEEKQLIDFTDIHKDYTVSFDDYEESVEQVFRGIVAKDEQILDKIGHVMDLIEALHYGNRYAAQMRTMIFTGDLGMKLYRYHMLGEDFYDVQDELQKKVDAQKTFRELKGCVFEHFERQIAQIYENGKSKDKVLIGEVKDYIREHYAEDLSIKELADVACVSQNYFSALFKKETGQNYKAYLTGIRMEEALKMLQETDYKTYEIGEKVGYNNVRRFVDAFKQIYSVSPMEYKKALRKDA